MWFLDVALELMHIGSFESHECGGKSHHGITLSAKALLEKAKAALVEHLNKLEG